jgi:hypothetical protein
MNAYRRKESITPVKIVSIDYKQKISEIRKLFREQWLLKRQVLSLGHQIKKLQNELLGLDDLENSLQKDFGNGNNQA